MRKILLDSVIFVLSFAALCVILDWRQNRRLEALARQMLEVDDAAAS